MCDHDSSRDGPGTRIAFAFNRAFEMPEWRLSLRRSQVLERTRVGQREQESAQNGLSSVSTYGVRQVSIFRHFVRRFLPLRHIGSNIFRRSRHSVAANCADGVSSASTHDSTSDEICDIFPKRSASSLHLIRHIHGRATVPPSRRQQRVDMSVINRENRCR
jgi:hypothetical protein